METAEEYLRRNEQALVDAEKLFFDPRYGELIEAKRAAKTDREREEAEGALSEYVVSKVDLDALHRHVRAQNRRLAEEGLLPPGL